MVPVLAVVLSLFYLWSPPLPWLRDGAIYVSPDGSNWNTGGSPESAVATIQRAADMVAPGESVVVLPGVYRETVRVRRGGEPGRPVTFRAETPGTVTITGAAPDSVVEALEWRDEGESIWSARPSWPMYHVVVDGLNLYHVRWGGSPNRQEEELGKIDLLREMATREGAWPAFTYENDRLYMSLPMGPPPGEREIEIHRRIPPPYASWTIRSANVWVEADHVAFEGLRFELGVGAGLLLWSARDVVVRNCLFSGATHGIRSFPRIRSPDGLSVEHSLYHNYPQARWLSDWLTWKETYRHHSYSTLVNVAADRVVAAFNIVAHGGDGLELSTAKQDVFEGVEIYGNLLFKGTDDAIELDGYARNVFIHHNLVYDWFVSLGLSPVLAGPVLAERNLFLGQSGIAAAHLKFINPWRDRPGELGGPIRDVAITGNIFVGGTAVWANGPSENIIISRNLFALEKPVANWPEEILVHDNQFIDLIEEYGNPGEDCSWAERLPIAREALPEMFGRVRLRKKMGREDVMPRPGPSWFDYSDLPATADIPERLSAALIEWQCK